MIRTHPIIKGAVATLLVAFGLIALVLANNRLTPPIASSKTDSVKVVRLLFTFSNGGHANVTEVEGGTIKIEKEGKKLAITPFIRDQSSGTVELRVYQSVQREGQETMEAVDSLLIDRNLTKLNHSELQLSVQVMGIKTLPANLPIAPAAVCCARACDGTLICGVCVCTDCESCSTRNWCDCPPPAPPEE